MHLLSTMFSPTIPPSTHSATSLHQHWSLLIWFTFCSFLSLLTWLLTLSTYPFISPPSILPILPAALTLSLTLLQHHHELLFPLKLRTTLQLISLSFQNIWFFSSIVILLGKWHSPQHNWNPCCLTCISDSILLPLLLPVPISSQGEQTTKWPHLCALLTNFFPSTTFPLLDDVTNWHVCLIPSFDFRISTNSIPFSDLAHSFLLFYSFIFTGSLFPIHSPPDQCKNPVSLSQLLFETKILHTASLAKRHSP